MYILGLSSYSHESSAALIKDGKICSVFEEERLNREKHTCKFPRLAITQCLKQEGITFQDIDQVTFFWKPWRELTHNIQHVVRYFPQSLRLLGAPSNDDEYTFFKRFGAKRNVGREIQKAFALARPPQITYVEHHLAHAASAFFVSPFEKSAILTVDGRGESTTTMMAVGRRNRIEKLKEIKVPHSLGHLYAAVTDHLGFRPFFDEWKVMGMAAYGGPTWVKAFEDLVELSDDGGFRLNLRYFRFQTRGRQQWLSPAFSKRFGPPRRDQDAYDQRHFDLALGLQRVVEKAGVHLARALQRRTGLENLCMTGGVVLNCLMNRRIVEETDFKRFFFQPIANDAGTSLGSALYYYHQVLGKERGSGFPSIYLGGEFSDEQIEGVLKNKQVRYRRCGDIAAETARCIAAGQIVGWFQGRMEAGPRALGNRSITVDPRDPNMKERLNARIKRREFFRPFAPSVLEEKAGEYFEIPKTQDSPFMILTGHVRKDKTGVIPAVTHADGTARVHTVNRLVNPLYWRLISEFEKLTGVPVLLNTSFNENEPIVCSVEDAVNCFLRTEFDVLAIGSFLVSKT